MVKDEIFFRVVEMVRAEKLSKPFIDQKDFKVGEDMSRGKQEAEAYYRKKYEDFQLGINISPDINGYLKRNKNAYYSIMLYQAKRCSGITYLILLRSEGS